MCGVMMVGRAYSPNPTMAADWLRHCYGRETPVNPAAIARRLGIELRYMPLSSDRSGMLMRTPRGFVIVVNRDQSLERRAWTIAHELGHWVMHRYMRSDFTSMAGSKGLFEREANTFAAQLLMPEKIVRELAPKKSFGGLAAYFGVSLQAMHVRLCELGVECM
jgi:Zn-dependent peptidase ImmA (M78 family)